MPAGWLTVVVLLCAATAVGQRVQFPTTVPGTSGAGVSATAAAPPPAAVAPMAPAPVGQPPPMAAPAPMTSQGAMAPMGTAPPSLQAPPPGAPPATFGGTVQPAPSAPTWDPYSTGPQTTSPVVPTYTPPPVGAAGQPSALYPGGAPWSGGNSYAYTQPGIPATTKRRLLQEMRIEYTWMPSNGSNSKFGISGLEFFGTFGFPMFGNMETPLLLTPGFAFATLTGPVTTPKNQADMPGQLYDAYLDLAWGPKITPWLAVDLGLRFGIYSDFTFVDSGSVRVMGRGLGVITFTPTTQISLGFVYLDRNNVKILPAGGVIWTPNPKRRWEIVFPNPKLACRLQDVGTTEMWWYVSGEYGGGNWSITRADLPYLNNAGEKDSVDYNDIRINLGLEWTSLSGRNGFAEIAYVLNRELVYASNDPVNYNLTDTLMFRTGVSF